jgi:hypothetical protein
MINCNQFKVAFGVLVTIAAVTIGAVTTGCQGETNLDTVSDATISDDDTGTTGADAEPGDTDVRPVDDGGDPSDIDPGDVGPGPEDAENNEDTNVLPDTGPAPECVDPPSVSASGSLDCSAGAGSAVLPQNHPYQVTLRNYIACFSEDDLDVDLADLAWEPADYGGDSEELHRQWIALREVTNNLPEILPVRVDSSHFTLSGIERDGKIYLLQDAPKSLAFWSNFDLPQNPYHQSDALKRRAFVTAAVDIMMLDQHHEGGGGTRSDFLGANMLSWAYAYRHAKDILPDEIRAAFEAGMLRHLSKLEDWGPKDVNTNMDTKSVAALAEMGQVMCKPETKQRIADQARTILFGSKTGTPSTSDFESGIFHRAGYVGEADGPETTYNGISLNHLTEAAIISRGDPLWDGFMQEVVRRMAKFKTYQMFPQPDGFLGGPSNFSKRTSESYAFDQHASRFRNRAVAMLNDDGLALLSHRSGGLPSIPDMEEEVNETADNLNQHRDFGQPSTETPEEWFEDHWRERAVNYTFDYYVPGSYARFRSMLDADDPRTHLPFERDVSFDASFDDEFWSGRADHGANDWGFFIETVRDAGWGYDRGYLGGGGVSEFWTQKTGTIIRGRTRGNSGSLKPRDTYETLTNWASNHVWGVGAGGEMFSTAKNRETDSTYDLGANVPTASVIGAIGKNDDPYDYARWMVNHEEDQVYDEALAGPVMYKRTFEKTADGLRVTAEFNTNGSSETVSKLWENIPIFLFSEYEWRQDQDRLDANVEFRVDGGWQEATSSLTSADAIRVTRFGEYAYIVFDQERQMRTADSQWSTTYQTSDKIQVVHIDMLDGGGPSLDTTKSITWTATTNAP